jgi:DNA sulfur modification protein DndE
MSSLSNIRTSLANKSVVTDLTHKLMLGSENIVARIAFAYSLSSTEKLDLKHLQDSKGKEYSPKVLFGPLNIPVYVGLICQKYSLQRTSGEVGKYIKIHLDDGLEKLDTELKKGGGLTSLDFLMPRIQKGLETII